jgi:hypothetical protein
MEELVMQSKLATCEKMMMEIFRIRLTQVNVNTSYNLDQEAILLENYGLNYMNDNNFVSLGNERVFVKSDEEEELDKLGLIFPNINLFLI